MNIVSELKSFFELIESRTTFIVCTYDELNRMGPLTRGINYGMVVNLSHSRLPLSHHWAALYVSKFMLGIYFEPTGFEMDRVLHTKESYKPHGCERTYTTQHVPLVGYVFGIFYFTH